MGPDGEGQSRAAGEHDTVRELGPEDTGTWVITTRHTRYVLDLDRWTYRREPGPDSTPMLHDDRTVPLTKVQLWAKVGGIQFIWFDDPDVPDLVEHWRMSSTITDISPLPATPDDAARDEV